MRFSVRAIWLSWFFAGFVVGHVATGQEAKSTCTVTGQIVDEHERPIADADIRVGDYQNKVARTDSNGNFRIATVQPGRTHLFVFAPGKAPQMRDLEPAVGSPSLKIKMGPALTIGFRVVDSQRRPVERAFISGSRWGARQEWAPVFTAKTHSDGTAQWHEAPEIQVTYEVSKPGFARREITLVADGKEHEVVLPLVLKISGSVTDVRSGTPVETFKVVPVLYFDSGLSFLDRNEAQPCTSGQFAINLDRMDALNGLQIEAFGYRTARTGRYKIGDANPLLQFRMEPAERYRGQVLDARGKPQADARVYLVTDLQDLTIAGYTNADDNAGNCHVNTDAEGRFEIAPPAEHYALIVNSSAGYVEVERQANELPGHLQLRPWASVKGQLLQDGQPIAASEVHLRPIRGSQGSQSRIQDRWQVKTDKDGRFGFERVPPFACCVEVGLSPWEKSPLTSGQSLPLQLQPGQVADIVLGGPGASVTGKVTLSQNAGEFDYHWSINYLLAKRPGIEPPPSIAAQGFDWRKGWSYEWTSSPDGIGYFNTLHHRFVMLEPDGRLRISGLEPGEYQLVLQLYNPPGDGCLAHPVGTKIVEFTITGEKSQQDLGNLSVEPMQAPKIGDLAFSFELTESHGAARTLADLRGKCVLLDFWATWCLPCVTKLDQVEQIRKQFGDQSVAIVGLNLDENKARAKKFLETKELPWHHVLLGEWSTTEVPKQFGISTVPAYVLIDPQGRIVASDISLEPLIQKLKTIVVPPSSH